MHSVAELMRKGLNGGLTAEERSYYIHHFMSDEEKQIGKPLFEMNRAEELEFDKLCFNRQKGTLTDYDCPICKNKGEVMKIKDGVAVYSKCACMAIRQSVANMRKCGLCELLNIYKFSNYKQEEEWQKDAFKKAREFIDSNANGFVFCGQSGIGKTHLCTAISRALLNRGMELHYMPWIDESAKIKQVANDLKAYGAIVDKLKKVQVLYIDDFFKTDRKATPTAADIRLANEIINYRYNKCRSDKSRRMITIISTEKSVKQLNECDNAVAGRLIEMAGNEFLLQIFGKEKNYRVKSILGDEE